MKKYRLKDEKYRKAAQEITGFGVGGSLPLEHFVSLKGSGMRMTLEEYGVFDLWFEEEPKYKAGDYIVALEAGQSNQVRKIVDCEIRDGRLFWNEYEKTTDCFAHSWELAKIRHATEVEIKEYNRPKFKSGDYIYTLTTRRVYKIEDCEVIEDELNWNTVGVDREGWDYRFCAQLSQVRHATAEEIEGYKFKTGDYIYITHSGNMYEIENCEVIGDELHWNTVGVDKGWKYRFSTCLNYIRHATAEEIEEYNRPKLPLINGYEGKQEGDYIIYGCQKIHREDFRDLYRACLDTNITSITIAGQQVKIETLQELYEKTY